MKYAYENLSPTQFEKLIVHLCYRLLGIATVGFSEGPDGGRDAKFVGTAELHPSKSAPWVGTTIIQAKHTNGLNRSFSETEFYSSTSANTTLGKEIPRITRLRADKELDHYMLFSNRRLSATAESEVRAYLASECGIPESSLYLCGIEQLEMLLKRFPDIPKEADLDPLDSPLIITPDLLADVIDALARNRDAIGKAAVDVPVPRVSYEKKNALNNMTKEFAKSLRRKYLKDTAFIDAFLADPVNRGILEMYHDVAEEMQLKIVAHRKEYQDFDKVMNYLFDLLLNRDAVLGKHRRLTRTMLFYMYWVCDIGEVDDAEA